MPSLADLLGLAPTSAPWNSNPSFPSGLADASGTPWWLRSVSPPSSAPFANSPNIASPADLAPNVSSGGWLGDILAAGGTAKSPTSGGILQGAVPDEGQHASSAAEANWPVLPLKMLPLGWPIATGGNLQTTQANDSPAPMSRPTAVANGDPRRSSVADFFQSIPYGILTSLASAASANGQAAQIEMLQPIDVPSADKAAAILEQSVTGPLPRPQGIGGQFGATVGEFLGNPLSYLIPGSIGARLAAAVSAGVGSEAAGQLTKGKWAEPFARIGGAAVGGGAGVSAMQRGAATVESAANAFRRFGIGSGPSDLQPAAERSARSIATRAESIPGKSEPSVGSPDVANFRARIGVPDTRTVAVARTNVPGLENMTLEGASPLVRKEGGLPPVVSGPIEAPWRVARHHGHAEEDIANQFIRATEQLGLKASDLDGYQLAIHVSNPRGVCNMCRAGLDSNNSAGVLKQLADRYPGLRIYVTVETKPGIAPRGPTSFVIQNGRYLSRSDR